MTRFRLAGSVALGLLAALSGCVGAVGANRTNKVPPFEPLVSAAATDRYFKDRRLDPIEGVWIWDAGEYEVAIVRDEERLKGYEYLGILVDARNGTWRPGEVKFALRRTAAASAFSCLYWAGDGTEFRTTLLQTDPNLLSFTLPIGLYGTQQTTLLLRTYPIDTTSQGREPSSSGTAFWVASDTLATNEHVIRNAKEIRIVIEGREIAVDQLASDTRNDLALLRVREQPTGSVSANASRQDPLRLGERVFVIGYPLSTILGSSPTVSEGIVSKLTGIEDDPREFQVSAPIQSGSSGSPVFDENGVLIGVLSSTLNAGVVVRSGASAPQNVNFAVRSSYLTSLMEAKSVSPPPTSREELGSSADFARKMGKVVVQVKVVR
jgi:S1-C subfamily serine protease